MRVSYTANLFRSKKRGTVGGKKETIAFTVQRESLIRQQVIHQKRALLGLLSIREGERKSASKIRGFWTHIGRGKSFMGRASSFSESTYLYHSHSNGHWPNWRFDLGIFMDGDLYVVKIGARVIHQPLMIARRKESSGTSCLSQSQIEKKRETGLARPVV